MHLGKSPHRKQQEFFLSSSNKSQWVSWVILTSKSCLIFPSQDILKISILFKSKGDNCMFKNAFHQHSNFKFMECSGDALLLDTIIFTLSTLSNGYSEHNYQPMYFCYYYSSLPLQILLVSKWCSQTQQNQFVLSDGMEI